MEPTVDHFLWKKIKGGDYKALTRLFEKYYQRLCAFAFSILEEFVSVEELVSDVFLKIWEGREHLDIQDPKAYLFKATKNQALKVLRSRVAGKITIGLGGGALPEEMSFHENDPESQLITEENVRNIENLVDVLPPKCRTIFYLSREEQMSYQEIADQLEISIKTVENQMGKALKLLREAYLAMEE